MNTNKNNGVLGMRMTFEWLTQAMDYYVLNGRSDPPDPSLLLRANSYLPMRGVDEMNLYADADGDVAIRLILRKPKSTDATYRDFDPHSIAALQVLGLAECRLVLEPRGDKNDKFYMRGYFPRGEDYRRFEIRRFVADALKNFEVAEPEDFHSLQRKRLSVRPGSGMASFEQARDFARNSFQELVELDGDELSLLPDLRRLTDLIDLSRMVLKYLPLGRR